MARNKRKVDLVEGDLLDDGPLSKRNSTFDWSDDLAGSNLIQWSEPALHRSVACDYLSSKTQVCSNGHRINGMSYSHLDSSTDLASASFMTCRTFQEHLQDFCTTPGHFIRAAYMDALRSAYEQVMSSNDLMVILAAGQAFIESLSQCMSELQQAAAEQIRRRMKTFSVGVLREAVDTCDVFLEQLDTQIISINTAIVYLTHDLNLLQAQYQSWTDSQEHSML